MAADAFLHWHPKGALSLLQTVCQSSGSLPFSGITAAKQLLGLFLNGGIQPVVWYAGKRRARFVTIFAGYYFHSPGGASILCQKSRQNASVFVVFLPRVDTRGYNYLAPSELLRSPPRRTREVYGSLPAIWHAAKT
jgi:hypothetical protein